MCVVIIQIINDLIIFYYHIAIFPSGNGCAWLLVLKYTVYACTCHCFSAKLKPTYGTQTGPQKIGKALPQRMET